MVKVEYKGPFGKIGQFFDWITNIYVRIKTYNNLSEAHKREFEKSTELYSENQRLETENENLIQQRDFFAQENADYQKGIEESPSYQKLEAIKIETEKERDSYKKVSEHRGLLINFLKEEQRKTGISIENFVNYITNKKIHEAFYKFLENRKELSNQPYIFVDPEGKIIFYTTGFRRELKLKENIQGSSYLSILNGKYNIDKIRFIKKFFLSDKEEIFDVEIETGRKPIPLRIIKGIPAIIDLDLSYFGQGKKNLTYVPLLVHRAGRWTRIFHPEDTLDRIIEKSEEEEKLLEEMKSETPRLHARLVRYLEWRDGKIDEVMEEMGEVKAYLYMKHELSKKIEIERKLRKKEARERLRRIKARRKSK